MVQSTNPFFRRPHEFDRNGYCWRDGSRDCEYAELHARTRSDNIVIVDELNIGDEILLGKNNRLVVTDMKRFHETGYVITDEHGNNHVLGKYLEVRKIK